MAQAFEAVVRRLEGLVRYQQHGHALLEFDLGDLGAFLVQQERGHFHRHLNMYGGGVVLHRLFLNHAQDLQCARFGVTNMAGAVAARARDMAAFTERRTQALAAQLQQAELADGAELDTRTVLTERVAQASFDFAAVLRLFHVDKVNHDQAAQVAQSHLACDLVSSFKVGSRGGFFDVRAARRAGRVHVDRDQCLGVIDHDRAARRQIHGA